MTDAVEELLDSAGETILHASCRNSSPSASARIVDFLLDKNPNLIGRRSKEGYLALHIACGHCGSDAAVLQLVQRFPEAADDADNALGEFPLHMAARNCAEAAPKMVELLLQGG